jgi:hypothetical protein
MPSTKLTEFNQSTFIKGGSKNGSPAAGGICYYICDFLEKHKDSPINTTKSFAALKSKCTRMATHALVAAGKASNVKNLPQFGSYSDATPLKDNSLYRVEVAVGVGASINHETLMITGAGETIVFDPNYGFYHVDISPAGHAAKFEKTLKSLYGGSGIGKFGYKKIKKLY